jgi:hypothetical protein
MSSEMIKIGDRTATHSASTSMGAQKKKMDDHLDTVGKRRFQSVPTLHMQGERETIKNETSVCATRHELDSNTLRAKATSDDRSRDRDDENMAQSCQKIKKPGTEHIQFSASGIHAPIPGHLAEIVGLAAIAPQSDLSPQVFGRRVGFGLGLLLVGDRLDDKG